MKDRLPVAGLETTPIPIVRPSCSASRTQIARPTPRLPVVPRSKRRSTSADCTTPRSLAGQLDEVGDAALAGRVEGEVNAAGRQRADTLHQTLP